MDWTGGIGIDDLLARAVVVSIPTRTRFRGLTLREAMLIRGDARWTEFSPFPEYDDTEAAVWLRAALEYGWATSADLPFLHRNHVVVNATLPAVGVDEIPALLARFRGCTTVKIKVAERGQTLADDIARVRRTRELMGDDALIRVDANGGWSVAEAVEAIRQLAAFDIDYVEQPCASVEALGEVRDTLRLGGPHVRIAADESVRKASDPLAVARAHAADLLVVKAQPLGGISRAASLIAEAGLPVVISSALDTSVGISMGARLAASLPEELLDGACGLATVELLSGDVTHDSLVPEGGEIPVGDVEVDDGLIDRYRATPDRTAWWFDRTRRCWDVLTS